MSISRQVKNDNRYPRIRTRSLNANTEKIHFVGDEQDKQSQHFKNKKLYFILETAKKLKKISR